VIEFITTARTGTVFVVIPLAVSIPMVPVIPVVPVAVTVPIPISPVAVPLSLAITNRVVVAIV
jgi:hypothetical protein